MAHIVCIGEAMVELSRAGGAWSVGYGGDTLNAAIHMARAGHDASFLTALGADPLSVELRTRWQADGLDTSLVLTHPVRQVGVYAVATDQAGDRSFYYWRESSAARAMFDSPGIADALDRAAEADLLCFSLITLAILPPPDRAALFDLAGRIRARGGKVAFDSNYRPRLWPSVEDAIAAHDAGIACSDIGLPTLDDEMKLRGFRHADEVAGHWRQLGCDEVVVKLSAAGCRLPDGSVVPPERVREPLDTSGAGDAFNGGYLAARMAGLDVARAARLGQSLAAEVIMRPGAIPDVPEWRSEWTRGAI